MAKSEGIQKVQLQILGKKFSFSCPKEQEVKLQNIAMNIEKKLEQAQTSLGHGQSLDVLMLYCLIQAESKANSFIKPEFLSKKNENTQANDSEIQRIESGVETDNKIKMIELFTEYLKKINQEIIENGGSGRT